MKKLLPFLLLATSFIVNGQVYHPIVSGDTVKWQINYGGFWGSGSNTYRTNGDTLIGLIKYTKLLANGSTFLFREDSAASKIYVKRQGTGQDDLLFDFSLQLNDTISIAWYDGMTGLGWTNFLFTVDSVSQTTIAAGVRKLLRLQHTGNYNVTLHWLESVGAIYHHGPLYYRTQFVDDCCDTVACQSINNNATYISNNTTCSFVLSSIPEAYEPRVTFYPNPFSTRLTFFLADNEQTTVSLYDFLGQQVLQQTCTNSATVNTERLADGIYFYELRSNKGTLKAGKVVKQ